MSPPTVLPALAYAGEPPVAGAEAARDFLLRGLTIEREADFYKFDGINTILLPPTVRKLERMRFPFGYPVTEALQNFHAAYTAGRYEEASGHLSCLDHAVYQGHLTRPEFMA